MHDRQYYRLPGRLFNRIHPWEGGVKHQLWQSSNAFMEFNILFLKLVQSFITGVDNIVTGDVRISFHDVSRTFKNERIIA
jgi:hypothetical protein